MLYLFSRHRFSTLFAVFLMGVGVAVFAYVVLSYNGNFMNALLISFLGCAAISTASKTLTGLYGQHFGNRRRYRIAPCLDGKNTSISDNARGLGLKLHRMSGMEFYAFTPKYFLEHELTVEASDKIKESEAFKVRLGKMSYYFQLWWSQALKKSLPAINRGCDEKYTYAVDIFQKLTLSLKRCDWLSAIVDQKLLCHKLVLSGKELNNSIHLFSEESFVELKLPQDCNLISGLMVSAIFVTRDGYIIPSEHIESTFYAYYLGDWYGALPDFCLQQIKRHLNGREEFDDVKFAGIGLIAEDVGAPTLVCGVKLKRTWQEITGSDVATNQVHIREIEKKLTDSYMALTWYYLQGSKEWFGAVDNVTW